MHSPTSPEKKSSLKEQIISTIKEEDEAPEEKHSKHIEMIDREGQKSVQMQNPEREDRSESPKLLSGFVCLMPSNQPVFFVAQKTCFVMHFSKSEEIQKILNFEKMSKVFSMAIKPKKSSIRRSRKDLKFGQQKEKKELII